MKQVEGRGEGTEVDGEIPQFGAPTEDSSSASHGSRRHGYNPIRPIYEWVLSWADRPGGPWALVAFAFAESSFFPVPPDVLLIPLCLSVPGRALVFATMTTVASVIGGMFGYWIGYAAYESIGRPLLEFYGATEGFETLGNLYRTYDAWAVGLAGFTPIPYKVFTIAAGFFSISFPIFVVASTFGRGGRFFLVAILLWLFGEPVKAFIDRYFNWLTLLLAALFVAGFLVLHYGLP